MPYANLTKKLLIKLAQVHFRSLIPQEAKYGILKLNGLH